MGWNSEMMLDYVAIRLTILLPALILTVAVVGLFTIGQTTRGPSYEVILSSLPALPDGWTSEDMPIATSEEMKTAVKELLNYDRAVFREYKHGGKSFTLFVTYWGPRKIHPRLVDVHAPDVCWVSNGWKMESPNYAWRFPPAILNYLPAQYRVFARSNGVLNVLYWHVVDGKISPYVGDPSRLESSAFAKLWNDFGVTSGEQFFIRLSSAQSFEEWHKEPFFVAVLKSFSPVLDMGHQHSK